MALAGLIIAIIACVAAVGSFVFTISRDRERRHREEVILKRTRFPSTGLTEEPPFSPVRLRPQFFAREVEHNYTIVVRFPEGAAIEQISAGDFVPIYGGMGERYVVFQKGVVYPGKPLKPIEIRALKEREEVRPDEYFSWTQEESGYINIPYIPELEKRL